ncbi:hypothetical protein [Rubrivirga sp.]|uniref:hypothetical protein n=1 Tax=Rubrivirga sp. TaxID=1885344 RepID=UPI003C761BC8
MRRLCLLIALAILTLPVAVSAQPIDLDDATKDVLRIELREMYAADQRVRDMNTVGTFSPCEAERARAHLDSCPTPEA